MSSSACGRMHSAIIEAGERRVASELGESLREAGMSTDREFGICERCGSRVQLHFEINGWFWAHAPENELMKAGKP